LWQINAALIQAETRPSNPEQGDRHERMKASPQQAGFASIMVPLDLGARRSDRLGLALSRAERFGSRLIGITRQALAENSDPSLRSGFQVQRHEHRDLRAFR
jgi:hypothetical protein